MDTSSCWQSVPGTAASFALVVNIGSEYQRVLANLESATGAPVWLYQLQGEDHVSPTTKKEICEAVWVRATSIRSGMTQSRNVMVFKKSTIDEKMTLPVHFQEFSELEKEFQQSVVWHFWISWNVGLRVRGEGLYSLRYQAVRAKPTKRQSEGKRQTILPTDTEDAQLRWSTTEAVAGLDRSHPQNVITEETEVSDTYPAINKAIVHDRWSPSEEISGLSKADLQCEHTRHTYVADDRPTDDGKRASEADAEELPADLHEDQQYDDPLHHFTSHSSQCVRNHLRGV
ncbi:hypothetical protein MMC32_006629 [Xylographa parallela]|nr:hypothetical protein [Xylographa parallela]